MFLFQILLFRPPQCCQYNFFSSHTFTHTTPKAQQILPPDSVLGEDMNTAEFNETLHHRDIHGFGILFLLMILTLSISSLLQALCGCTVSIPTLENRVISLPCHDIIKPGTVKRLRGEGLPFPKNPSQRGDLIVEFSVRFPDRIPPQSREIIRQHLPQS